MKTTYKEYLALSAAVAILGSALATGSGTVQAARENDTKAIPLKEAKLNIEHNATDEDTGFQGAIDSEGWKQLIVTGPGGSVLKITGQGKLGELGLTELFFESVEPENKDVSIEDMLAMLPEGNYIIKGPAIENGESMGTTKGTAWLTHAIPAGPVLVLPKEGAIVPTDKDLEMKWKAVNATITGAPVKIISYQLIVEKVADPHPHMIGKRGSLSMYLSASATSMRVPKEFLEPKTKYAWEVLAIEESGNQTLSSGSFSTR